MPNSSKAKNLSVTVGIPAFNEENTIVELLTSILAQKQKGFILKHIIVITDASRDRTPELVRTLAKQYKQITLIERRVQKGKTASLNQFYQLNQSDILVTFDADIYLRDPLTIAKMVQKFTHDDVVLVSANDLPASEHTFAQKIVNTWYGLWHYITKDFKKGNNIYNVHGNASALKREFAKSIIYPKNITADQDFLYLSVIDQKKRYVFARDSIILFHTPDSIAEFSFQTSRFLNEKAAVFPQFGEWTELEYHIPWLYKLEKVAMFMAEDPMYFFLAALVYAYVLFIYKKRDPLNKQGLWQQVASTKKSFARS